MMSFIASKLFYFYSSRNTTLSNDLSLQMSIVLGSFFIFGISMLLLTKASSWSSDHPAFGYILIWFICGNGINQCSANLSLLWLALL